MPPLLHLPLNPTRGPSQSSWSCVMGPSCSKHCSKHSRDLVFSVLSCYIFILPILVKYLEFSPLGEDEVLLLVPFSSLRSKSG